MRRHDRLIGNPPHGREGLAGETALVRAYLQGHVGV
jgi:hypothetical protein